MQTGEKGSAGSALVDIAGKRKETIFHHIAFSIGESENSLFFCFWSDESVQGSRFLRAQRSVSVLYETKRPGVQKES